MTTKVVKGSLWTLVGQVAPLAISLVATPFVVRLLGAEGYGVLILVGLIPVYLGFADFGMSMASTKFGSEAYAEGDPEKEGRIVRTAALIALCTSVPIAALIMIFASNIIGLFNVPTDYTADATLALRFASITFVINFLCGIVNAPLLARLRMDLNTFISSGTRILGLISMPVVLYLGYGLVGATMVLLVTSLLSLVGHVVIASRLNRKLLGMSLERHTLRPIFKYGSALAMASIAVALLLNSEKVILAKVTSVEQLAYYSVAFTLAFMMTLFSVAMAQSLIPAFSQLQGASHRQALSGLYSRAIRMNAIWVIPTLAILAVFSQPLITIWAGARFGEESSLPFYLLIFGVGFHVVATPARAALMASGRSDIIAKVGWLEIVPFIAVVWVLASRFGAVGAAIAWSFRAVIDALVTFVLAHKVGGVTFIMNRPASLALATLVMLIAPLAWLLIGANYFWLSCITVATVNVYSWIIWKFVLETNEAVWLLQLFRRTTI